MPPELGMVMARRFMDPASEHDWLVLAPKGHAYLQFVSDWAAYDPAMHDGTIPGVVIAVMAWLSTRKEAAPAVTPKEVLPLFQERFSPEKERRSAKLGAVIHRGLIWLSWRSEWRKS